MVVVKVLTFKRILTMSKIKKYKNLRTGDIFILDPSREVREINGERFIPAIEESTIGTAAAKTNWYKESSLTPFKENR